MTGPHGFRFLPIDKVASLPRDKFFDRVEAAGAVTGDKKAFEAAAILGAVDQPKITVSTALDLFWGMTGPLGRAIKGLFEHIGELTTITATFAGVLGIRLVASLTAAALCVGKLALSMKVLRAAIIRTGIGALIVGAGELIYPPQPRRQHPPGQPLDRDQPAQGA